MPRAGEGRSIRIDPEVYEAILALKRGNMTFSDVIAQMLRETYGWSDDTSGRQCDLSDFPDVQERPAILSRGERLPVPENRCQDS